MMAKMANAGGGFLPNGDLLVGYHRPGYRILVKVTGFRGGEKVLVDSYVLQCHPCCGVPKEIGHAWGCRTRR